ncbi:MAG: addiction module protein [Lentisphaeraceae bacterium]|nr:addiction module protein [Lentisphaeraceae bacterium]
MDIQELKDLSTDEKLMAMEYLWQQLSQNKESVKTPEWHKDILLEREGNEKFTDWNVAKKRIRASI